MKPRCGDALAAVWASAVRAGIIASSSGSASAVPIPRSTVRRERCFLVMNMDSAPGNDSIRCAGGVGEDRLQPLINARLRYFAATCFGAAGSALVTSTSLDWNSGEL